MAKKTKRPKSRKRGSRIGRGPKTGWRIYRVKGLRQFVAARMSVYHTGGTTFAVFRIVRDESRGNQSTSPRTRTNRR
jgi:hypothetical protein